MKRLLSLLIALTLVIPAGVGGIFTASADEIIRFTEDFSSYEGGLPNGWKLSPGDGTQTSCEPVDAGVGHGTAIKITAEGENTSTFDVTPGINLPKSGTINVSFQIYFDNIGDTAGKAQQITIALGNGSKQPVSRGVRITNGKVAWAYDAENRWSYRNTTASVVAGKWYTFDVITDFDNNNTTYYMNGTPLVDETTGNVINQRALANSTTSFKSYLVAARTKHPEAQTGGDVILDNITITNSLTGGAYSLNGANFTEDTSSFDIGFNNTISVEDFDESQVGVKGFEKGEYFGGKEINFSIENVAAAGCQIALNEDLTDTQYDRIEVDFGKNKDFLGNKLSKVYFDKTVAADSIIINTEDDSDDDLAKITTTSFAMKDYDYKVGDVDKTALLFTTSEEGDADIKISRKDDTNLFKTGNEYELSFKMKLLESDAYKDGKWEEPVPEAIYRLSSQFDAVKDVYEEGAARFMYFSSKYNTPKYYLEGSSAQKLNFSYPFNKVERDRDDDDALFESLYWITVTMKLYPDDKLFDLKVERTGGKLDTYTSLPMEYSDDALLKVYATENPDVNRDDMDGSLKNFRITTSGAGRKFILDELKIVETPLDVSNAAIKKVVFKDADGSVLQNIDGVVTGGVKTIELHMSGEVNELYAYDIYVDNASDIASITDYNSTSNIITITADGDYVFGGSDDYEIVIPSELGLSGDVTSIAFSVADGVLNVNTPIIKNVIGDISASTKVENTSLDDVDGMALVAASYIDGRMFDADAKDVSADGCGVYTTATDVISASYDITDAEGNPATAEVDTIKAFVLDKSTLTLVNDYAEVSPAEPSDKAQTYEYTYKGNTEGSHYQVVVMKANADDKSKLYQLTDISDADTFEYIDVKSVKDGKYDVGFDVVSGSGLYEVYIVAEDGEVLVNEIIFHLDTAKNAAALQDVNSAVKDNADSTVLKDVIATKADDLGISAHDLYQNADKDFLVNNLYSVIKAQGIDLQDKEAVLKIASDIMLVEALNAGKVDDIADYDDFSKALDDKKIALWYGKGIADTKEVTARLASKSLTIDTFETELLRAIAFEIISTKPGSGTTKELVKAMGVNTLGVKIDVFEEIDGTDYVDFDAFEEAYEILASKDDGEENGPVHSARPSVGKVSVSVGSAAPVAKPIPVFVDLAGYEWAEESITELYKKQIVNGKTATTFAPNDIITREEFVKLVVEAFDIEATSNANFDDVPSDAWYRPYVIKAHGAGIVSGNGTSFGAGQSITRQDMAKIIYMAAVGKNVAFNNADLANVSDKDKIAQYALDAVSALYNRGVITGKGDGSFAPVDFATRAEAAVIIYRALALIR